MYGTEHRYTPSRIRILHVDDDRAFLDVTESFLTRELPSAEIVTVQHPDAASERLRAESFDCVVSDYEMPDTDGLELLSQVRDWSDDLPFLLYTGKGSEEIAADAISQGVDDYLRKDSGEGHYTLLANRIRRETERYRVEAEREERLAAMDIAREGICTLDADGRFSYANAAYCELYGYDREELLGESWQQVHPDPEADRLAAEVLPVVDEAGEWSGRGTGLRADGRSSGSPSPSRRSPAAGWSSSCSNWGRDSRPR